MVHTDSYCFIIFHDTWDKLGINPPGKIWENIRGILMDIWLVVFSPYPSEK